jgi:hypothetical protein
MRNRVVLILCAMVFVAACNKKSEPAVTDAKPSTGPATSAQSKADAITTAEGTVKAGANYGTFRAVSPTELKLAHGTTLTATPEGAIVAFRINDGEEGSVRCERAEGCTGACTWETSPTDANCSGAPEGAGGDDQTCACSWHYAGPDKVAAE